VPRRDITGVSTPYLLDNEATVIVGNENDGPALLMMAGAQVSKSTEEAASTDKVSRTPTSTPDLSVARSLRRFEALVEIELVVKIGKGSAVFGFPLYPKLRARMLAPFNPEYDGSRFWGHVTPVVEDCQVKISPPDRPCTNTMLNRVSFTISVADEES
jgi:hypothetical protein